MTISSCENDQPVCINPGIVADPPYEDPIWHPSGNIIGFNHRPIKEVILDSPIKGCKPLPADFKYKEDSVGFWLINMDGTNKRRILPYRLQTPAWSPDGKWVAFVKNAQIFKMPFDGQKFDTTQVEQLTFDGRNFFPAWSNDGEWISFDSNFNSQTGLNFIWKMRQNGSEKIRLSYTPLQGETRMPNWSIDFTIVHIRYLLEINNGSSEIFKMDSSGNNLKRLTNNTLSEKFPKYSLNQNKIGYIIELSGSRLCVIDSDGNNAKIFTHALVTNFSWSPEGTKILYQKDHSMLSSEDDGTLWIMNIDGTNQKQLTYNSFVIMSN